MPRFPTLRAVLIVIRTESTNVECVYEEWKRLKECPVLLNAQGEDLKLRLVTVFRDFYYAIGCKRWHEIESLLIENAQHFYQRNDNYSDYTSCEWEIVAEFTIFSRSFAACDAGDAGEPSKKKMKTAAAAGG